MEKEIKYKGKGEHSVRQLEEIIENLREQLHQKNLVTKQLQTKDEAVRLLEKSGYVVDLWSHEDITTRYHENYGNQEDPLTNKEVEEIVNLIKENYDANEGINWHVIDRATNDVIGG